MSLGQTPSRSLAGRAGGPILWLLIAAAVVQALAYLGPLLWRDDRYTGDLCQHVWWTYQFTDPALFPDDPIARYYAQPGFSPPAYQLLLRGLTKILDPQHAVESLAIVLALVSIAAAATLGAFVGRKLGAAAAVAVLMAVGGEHLVDGGFPRSFALPLLLLGAIALRRRRWGALGGVFVLGALFYPPTVLVLGPATAIVMAHGIILNRALPRGFATLMVLGLIAAAIVAAVYLRPAPAEVGRWYTVAEARQMPELQASKAGQLGGRTAFFKPSPAYYFTSPQAGIGLTVPEAAAAVVLLVATVALRPEAVPPTGWAFLVSALLTWAAAHALLFKLYLPSRYTMYALPVFGMIWAAGAARQMKLLVLDRGIHPKRRLRIAALILAVAFAGLLLANSARTAWAGLHEPGYKNSPPGYENVLAFLRTLPKETLIAAHPDDADHIPLRSRRSVLANTETSIAFHNEYYERVREKLNVTFDMLYAADWPGVDYLAKRYNVSVFVLDRTRLTHPNDRPYYKPFDVGNTERIAKAEANGFALLSPPADRVLFRFERLGRVESRRRQTMNRAWTFFALFCTTCVVALVLGARLAGPHDLYEKDQPKTMAYTADIVRHGRFALPRDVIYQPATKPPMYNWIDAARGGGQRVVGRMDAETAVDPRRAGDGGDRLRDDAPRRRPIERGRRRRPAGRSRSGSASAATSATPACCG